KSMKTKHIACFASRLNNLLVTMTHTALLLTLLFTQGCYFNKQSVAIRPKLLFPIASSAGVKVFL
ncbi:MAG TPA: hypothetical protein VLM78_05040, partial [Anaerolineales bacterium]|nr:hypothetical protein [Anaerolineales bacterium]